MAAKPWYKVVTPREDLREGKPLDASESPEDDVSKQKLDETKSALRELGLNDDVKP